MAPRRRAAVLRWDLPPPGSSSSGLLPEGPAGPLAARTSAARAAPAGRSSAACAATADSVRSPGAAGPRPACS
eukprot:15294280-Alexandrium_andersonii.AAC.1